jgi:hypothetical protein
MWVCGPFVIAKIELDRDSDNLLTFLGAKCDRVGIL